MSNYVLTPTAVRKLRRALSTSPGNGGAGGAPAAIDIDEYPPPYTVHWSQSENNGNGAWVIWLPYMPQSATDIPAFGPLLMVGNQYVDFLDGTAALPQAQTLPSGWFVLRNDAEGGAVYMNILVPTFWSSSSHVVAGITTAPDPMPSNEEFLHFSVLIATMTTDEDTGAKRVKQAVDSLIQVEGPIFGPNGEDIWPSDGGESTPQPFDIDNDVVVRCYAPAPCGTMLVGANYAIDNTKGDILVHVDRNSQTGVYTLTVDQTPRAESPTHHEWTLYQYQGGSVTCDCRPRVLPLVRFDDKSLDIDATNHNLQIKGWDSGTPTGQNLVNCLQNPNTSSVDRMLIPYRLAQPGGEAKLFYMPLGLLYNNGGAAMTMEYVADNDWYVNGSTHVLRKRLRVLNLQTGAITDKAGTTYANGWEVIANSTPVSSLLPSGS